MTAPRKYRIAVVEENGTARFHRTSRRSIRHELALLWDEYPKAKRIEIQVAVTPPRERMVLGLDGWAELFAPAVQS